VDITLVEGAISSHEDLAKIQTIRQRTKILVALGDCAVTGNVPAMRNQHPARKLLERIYVEGAQESRSIPTDGVPPLLRHAVPLHEVIKVDLHVPGCPPSAQSIGFVIGELAEGRIPNLGSKVKFG
jgi:NAD-reducing hydrogenase small subunit